ncbi:MAG: zinc ribbon domain-containing protein [Planctomycetes bacterium]|nr:zinc ribbon domain-containing protein [Planctomycetota bacterium]
MPRKCPHCGREVNTVATICIHCGRGMYSSTRQFLPPKYIPIPVYKSAPTNPKVSPFVSRPGHPTPHAATTPAANNGGLAKTWGAIIGSLAALGAGIAAMWRKITGQGADPSK